MKILLINPPVREQYPPATFPYGLAYITKFLLKAGHQVKILDIDTHRYSRERVLELLKKFKCDAIGTGGIITVYKYLKWLIPHIREIHPDAKLVVGGTLPTSVPKETLKGLDTDYIIIGEGEITAPELFSFLETHKHPKLNELKKIKGLGFKHNGKPVINPPREPIHNLDEIGFPDWEMFNLGKLLDALKGKMPLLTERGCPFRCNFCYHQFGYSPRRFSLERVVKEIKRLNQIYKVTHFTLCDNLFVFNKKQVSELISLLRKYRLNITFDTSMRASLITDELVKLLKKAGCKELNFGFESGSQRVLDLMNKQTKIEQMDNAIAVLRKNKMGFFGTFIIGYPGEHKEDVDQTIAFCKRNGLLAKPFFATPYPGTPLYEQIKHQIKNMDKFLESLGDARDLTINISEFSTKELIAQRRRVASETEKAYLKKHPVLGLMFSPLKLLNLETGFVVKMFIDKPISQFIKFASITGFNYLKGKKLVPSSDEGYDKTFQD